MPRRAWSRSRSRSAAGPIRPAGRSRRTPPFVHHDPDIYPDPYAFRPERFVGTSPGTYTWIPFGGGRRRCLGAGFALLEMKTVLRAVLSQHAVEPASGGQLERPRRRSITVHPGAGARVVLRERTRAPAPPPAAGAAAHPGAGPPAGRGRGVASARGLRRGPRQPHPRADRRRAGPHREEDVRR